MPCLKKIVAAIVLLSICSTSSAAELVRLTRDTWQDAAPRGKEVDAIFGDLVLRNDQIIAVIAAPLSTRNANMTVKNVGWSVIDLTRADAPNDQLSAFYPGSLKHTFTLPQSITALVDGVPVEANQQELKARGGEISITCTADPVEGRPVVAVRYTLRDGDAFLKVETIYANHGEQAYVEKDLTDTIRADRTFQFGVDQDLHLFWADDEWFRQTYGVMCESRTVERAGDRGVIVRYRDGDSAELSVPAGESVHFVRLLWPADSLPAVRGMAAALRGQERHQIGVRITDSRGPVRQARVTVNHEGKELGAGRTAADGSYSFPAPRGMVTLNVEGLGRPATEFALDVQSAANVALELPQTCGVVIGRITDDQENPIPCKVAFHGIEDTPNPYFGPDSDVTVENLRYTHNGRFRQEIGPGRYRVIITYGTEYDAVYREIEVRAGEDTRVDAKLVRTVDTRGWISSDFHSHSSPSGDNTCSQRARVLNLLAEHIEFAPCTEHNRVDSYVPHLRSLAAEHLLATCPGIELTGNPLPVNHQNAFPLRHRPRTQDGGGPTTDENPLVQIERLALWDDASEKLVQGNHPDLRQVLGDRDTDGTADGGFAKMLHFMDVIEVHPLEPILLTPGSQQFQEMRRNPIFHWMQMLNLGYRVTGVVNTDAHYSFHGSGGMRNYIRSTSDDPAYVDTMEMVRNSTAGQLVMTNGPFMTVEATNGSQLAGPGQDLPAPQGKLELHVRVQCPNWIDVNRVQVFVNGRAVDNLNFSRRTHENQFGAGAVKFDSVIPIALDGDAHIIVAAAGEGTELGPIIGPNWGKQMPTAVSNPIFVDVDGQGFKANGDLLDVPLPLEKTLLPIR